MASNDIKGTHDANPTGCDDVTADYFIQVVKDDGTTSDEGMSVPQLRSILQIDPGAARDVFSLSLPDNTLEAILGTLFGDYTHWQITESDTAPVYTDINWIAWPMPTILDWVTWTTKTKYLYVKDTSIVHTILTADGVSGITLTPVDTLGPVPDTIIWTLAAGTDPTTDIAVTLPDFDDAGIGDDRVDLLNYSVDSAYTLFKSDVATESPVNISGNSPGQTLDLVPIAYDLAGNTTELAHKEITLASAGSGEVNLTTTYFEGEEASTPLEVTLTWTGSGTAPAFDVDVSTVEYTESDDNAVAGVSYTTLSSETVNFPGTTEVITQNIALSDTGAGQNRWFGIVIDIGSATNSVVIGATNGANCLIVGSGSTGTGFAQDSSSDNLLVVRVPNMASVAAGSNSIYSESNSRSNDDLCGRTSNSGGADLGNATTIGDGTDATNPSDSSVPESNNGQGFRFADVVWNSSMSGTALYCWGRMYYTSGATQNAFHVTLDDANATSWLNLDPTSGNTLAWQWVKHGSTVNVTAGAATLQLHGYEQAARCDTLVFSTETGYDPNIGDDRTGLVTNDANYGPAQSALGDGGELYTPPEPPLPVPDIGGATATVVVSPINGNTQATVNTPLTVAHNGGSEMAYKTFTVTSAVNGNSSPVDGTVAVGDAYVRFTPAAPFDNSLGDVTVTGVATGTVRDTDREVKDWATGTWVFTIKQASEFGIYENFNDLPIGTKYSDVILGRLPANKSTGCGSKTIIVADPLGDPSRGNVLQVYHPAGTTGGTDQITGEHVGLAEFQANISSYVGSNDTCYFSYDIMQLAINPFSGNPQEIMLVTKLPGLAGATPITNVGKAAGGNQPWGDDAWSARGERIRTDGNRQTGFHNLVGYLYAADPDQNVATDTAHGCSTTYYNQCVKRALNADGTRFNQALNTWWTIETKVTRNTPSGGNPVWDGEYKIWVRNNTAGESVGTLMREDLTVPWSTDDIPINILFFATGYGGDRNNPLYYPAEDTADYYDNLIVSLTPITH